MKISLTVKDKNSQWEEKYEIESDVDIQEWGKSIITRYNETLRPHDLPRELVSCKVIKDEILGNHFWHKENAGTLEYRKRTFDIMKCSRCGVTGKRFGISNGVVIDGKYKAKKYLTCQWMNGKQVLPETKKDGE